MSCYRPKHVSYARFPSLLNPPPTCSGLILWSLAAHQVGRTVSDDTWEALELSNQHQGRSNKETFCLLVSVFILFTSGLFPVTFVACFYHFCDFC